MHVGWQHAPQASRPVDNNLDDTESLSLAGPTSNIYPAKGAGIGHATEHVSLAV
jgi:hypothetical protein